MAAITSNQIRITAQVFYQRDYSNPMEDEFMFAYRITIENHNSFPVKLLNRHWVIFESTRNYKEINGEGVIGIQPIIKSFDKYQYTSACMLCSEMGHMQGWFLMQNMSTKEIFKVNIPKSDLIYPPLYN